MMPRPITASFSRKCHLKKLKTDDPVLIGHSSSTPIYREVIRNYPELRANLCDVDGIYYRFPAEPDQKSKYITELNGLAAQFTGTDQAQNVYSFHTSLKNDGKKKQRWILTRPTAIPLLITNQ